jgi:outer membrane receptor protein involved in Fe transport
MSFAATAALAFGASTAYAADADADAADAPQATARASDQGPTIGELVVTARLREETAQTVPEAVVAITAEVLKDNNITNHYNLQGFAPSVAVNTNYVRDYSVLQIRGFGSSAYFGDTPTQPYSLYDLESVQILYGPQGTLFGYTALGGAVIYTPKHPEMNRFSAGLNFTIGNLNQHDVDGYINIPLIDDTLAARLSFAKNSTDGFTNIVGRDTKLDSNGSQSARLAIEWRPTERFSNYTNFMGIRQENTATSRVVVAYNDLFAAYQESGTTATGVPKPGPYPANFFNYLCTPQILQQVWVAGTTQEQCAAQHLAVLNNFRNQTLEALQLAKDSGNRTIPAPLADSTLIQLADNLQIQNVTNFDAFSWDGFLGGGEIRLKNAFSRIWYRNYINNWTVGAFDYYGTGYFTPGVQNYFPSPTIRLQPGTNAPPRNSFGEPQLGDFVYYTQNEFQLHGSLFKNLGANDPGITYVLGRFDVWSQGDANTRSSTNLPVAFLGAYAANEGPTPCCAAVMDYESHNYAYYFNATVDAGIFAESLKGLHFTGGLRYSNNHAERRTAPWVADYTSANTWVVNTAAISNPVITETDPLNWSFSIDYTTDRNMVYLNGAKIVVPGGANAVPLVPISAVPGYKSTYEDAELMSYEIGDKFRFEFDNGVRGYINADIYRMEYSNIQIPYTVFVGATATYFTYTTNPADAIYQGFEAQGELLFPDPNWGIYANFSYADSHYTEYFSTDPNAFSGGAGGVPTYSTLPGAVNSPLCVPDKSAATVIIGTTGTCIMDFSKSPLPLVPEYQSSVRVRYTHEMGSDLGQLVASATATYQSKMYFVPAQPILRSVQLLGPKIDAALSTPARTTMNARLQWNNMMGNENLSAGIWVTNLFDKTYATGAIDTLFAIGIISNSFSPPRQYGVSFSAKW